MEARTEDGRVVIGGDARQRFYDARGYGYPLEGNEIAVSWVEAAHLLLRGDLDAVDGREFEAFLRDGAGDVTGGDRAALTFLVYLDLRERGFYCSPAREGWIDDPTDVVDFVVYPRGKGPVDDAVAYEVRVVGERESIPAADLGDCTLAIVDEESEVTYFETGRPSWEGTAAFEPGDPVDATLLADRAVCWDAPEALYGQAFYGQPLGKRDEGIDALQLSLVETAQLVAAGALDVEGGYDAVVDRGRAVEGDRFDRRLQVYAALRERGVVPKTGFKFGADFRTYSAVESVDDLGHSERLVRVVPGDFAFDPRDLALDVRLAHGVRKQLVVAWPEDASVEWVSIERLTP
ncbi:tRNA splicing endonuclease [Salinarchaeum sp. Harcht-Bsk1]|uniref:tRNA-intron lyase n=1 Tax=Salinarchaeum sp. Harcht-Bsk1 TaxID=1333523 RepID=UPI0003422F72|nr:tRNA-intron lyase [Salinarchaeum sp. Harcht-Bsk1]AGN02192.1 tRNA splicing endonuclease [Salinarchaeum sp. Harcht-Bsk1]